MHRSQYAWVVSLVLVALLAGFLPPTQPAAAASAPPSIPSPRLDPAPLTALEETAAVPLASGAGAPASANTPDPAQVLDSMPLLFIPNRGQTDRSVRFQAQGASGSLFFSRDRVVLALPYADAVSEEPATGPRGADSFQREKRRQVRIDLQFGGTRGASSLQGLDQQAGIVNFLTGEKKQDWQTDLPTYSGLRYDELYPGIDLHFEGQGQQLKGTYTVTPGADPSLITWSYGQNADVHIDEYGDLQITIHPRGRGAASPAFTLTERAPIAWQEAVGQPRAVEVNYEIKHNGYIGFAVGAYDSSKPLIIDPTLIYSTFLGDYGVDEGRAIALSSVDNAIYLLGDTTTSSFPTTSTVYDTSHNGGRDIFITKLTANGTLAYSTFLGGSGDEYGSGIVVDNSSNVYIAGQANSATFPTTAGAYDTTYNGGTDAFIAKLTASGMLTYSSFLGGSGSEFGYGIAVDTSSNMYVTGYTTSNTFPTTSGAYDTSYNGSYDGFVTKFTTSGALAYSTFLGGTSNDYGGYGIAIDASRNVYVTGPTYSTNFPVTPGAYDTSHNGGADGFVTKLTDSGALAYSTFLGGSGIDCGDDLAVDANGNIYITGYAEASGFPVTSGAYDVSHNGSRDAFITKLTAGGGLAYSTFLGGSGYDYGFDIALDVDGNVYITGETGSANFPTTSGAYDTSHNGSTDAFVTRLTASGALVYSTFLGGSNTDSGYGIAVNGSRWSIIGTTFSSDFPTTSQAFDSAYNWYDVFVAILYEDTVSPSTPTNLHAQTRVATTIALAWDASSDNVGVTGYDIYRDSTLLGSSATTTYTATGLTSSTAYSFTVRARDAAGNVSALSTPLQARTLDITPPTAPTNLRVASATSSQVVLAWNAASDDVAVTGYDLYANAMQLGATAATTFTVSNLQVLASYEFRVAARDADGNKSPLSAPLTVTVPDTDVSSP